MMVDTSLLKKNKAGYLSGDASALDPEIRGKAGIYKNGLSRRMMSYSPEEARYRITMKKLLVSVKTDGYFQTIFFRDGEIVMCSTKDQVISGLPCLETVKGRLVAAKVKAATLTAELYRTGKDRERVYDVTEALEDPVKSAELGLLVFDILSLDGEDWKKNYIETSAFLKGVFGETGPVKAAQVEELEDSSGIPGVFDRMVTQGKAEGIIVRSVDSPLIYKVKPLYSLDAVIVGYSEGSGDNKGKARTVLLAFREGDQYRVTTRVGSSGDEAFKKDLFAKLSTMHVESEYLDTDREGTAFRMVRPEIVVEFVCNDFLLENSKGQSVLNPVIRLVDGVYQPVMSLPGVSAINPVLVRIREDKKNTEGEIPFSQITDRVPLESAEKAVQSLPTSKILHREVYQKEAKDKMMIQKFMVWETCKSSVVPGYPAYVFCYMDYSTGRKEMLTREIRVSSDKEQILQIMESYKTENIKKGWEKVK